MFTTNEVLELLAKANPTHAVTEDRLRHALRRAGRPRPSTFAGRLVWTAGEVTAIARAMKLTPPTFDRASRHGATAGNGGRR